MTDFTKDEIDEALRAYRSAKRKPNPWLRIIVAARREHGVRLTADEVHRFIYDSAFQTAAISVTDDELGRDEE